MNSRDLQSSINFIDDDLITAADRESFTAPAAARRKRRRIISAAAACFVAVACIGAYSSGLFESGLSGGFYSAPSADHYGSDTDTVQNASEETDPSFSNKSSLPERTDSSVKDNSVTGNSHIADGNSDTNNNSITDGNSGTGSSTITDGNSTANGSSGTGSTQKDLLIIDQKEFGGEPAAVCANCDDTRGTENRMISPNNAVNFDADTQRFVISNSIGSAPSMNYCIFSNLGLPWAVLQESALNSR